MRKHAICLLVIANGIAAAECLAQGVAQSAHPQVKIIVAAMHDQGCAQEVADQLNAAPGVKTVECDTTTQTVSISLEKTGATSLDRLWKAVEQANGKPEKLMTSEATYVLSPPAKHLRQPSVDDSAVYVVIDNLHCKGCAKKIAAKLYVLPGVTEVRVDMPTETLLMKLQSGGKLSPWHFVNAVRKANERPLSVTGPLGNLTIEWTTARPSKNHHHAQNQANGGTLR